MLTLTRRRRGSEASTTTLAKVDPATNSNMKMMGAIAHEIPPEDDVKPNFRTPPQQILIGSVLINYYPESLEINPSARPRNLSEKRQVTKM